MRDVLLGEPDLEAAVYTLIEMANEQGGKDNVTVDSRRRSSSAARSVRRRSPAGRQVPHGGQQSRHAGAEDEYEHTCVPL